MNEEISSIPTGSVKKSIKKNFFEFDNRRCSHFLTVPGKWGCLVSLVALDNLLYDKLVPRLVIVVFVNPHNLERLWHLDLI